MTSICTNKPHSWSGATTPLCCAGSVFLQCATNFTIDSRVDEHVLSSNAHDQKWWLRHNCWFWFFPSLTPNVYLFNSLRGGYMMNFYFGVSDGMRSSPGFPSCFTCTLVWAPPALPEYYVHCCVKLFIFHADCTPPALQFVFRLLNTFFISFHLIRWLFY